MFIDYYGRCVWEQELGIWEIYQVIDARVESLACVSLSTQLCAFEESEGSSVGGVLHADKIGGRWVRLPDNLYRLEYSYDRNVEK